MFRFDNPDALMVLLVVAAAYTLIRALEKAGTGPEAAVFVGDTVWDVQACVKAGVACIALLSGGIGRDELLGAGAATVYDGPADLLASLPDGILGRRRDR